MPKEDSTGELTDIPNAQYVKFFAKFKEIDVLPLSEWKPVHVIGYFSRKYEETFDKKYQFKFNSTAPSKCFEVFHIKKLSQTLSSNPSVLKDYIDWFFLNKVIAPKKRINSISAMTNDQIVNDFKFKYLSNSLTQTSNINRSTLLPDALKTAFADCGSVATYGDLSFLYQAVNAGGMDKAFVEKFNKCLIDSKLDKKILEQIV